MKHAAILFSLFLLTISLVSAQEDFTFSTPEKLDLCPCSNQAYPITITNTGDEASTYTVLASGQAADWTTFQPSSVTLNPNEQTTVFGFVNSVCNIEGTSQMDLFVSTANGLTRGLSQQITFNECYDYSVEFGQEIADVEEVVDFKAQDDQYILCEEQELFIPILIKNEEQFANRYKILLDAPEWATLQTESAQLQPNASGIALIRVNTQEVSGEFELKIDAVSELGKVQKKVEADVLVGDCLDFEIDIEEEEVTICSGQTNIIDVILRNNGLASQLVSMEVLGTDFARLQNDSYTVNNGQEQETKLFIFTQEEKDFEIEIVATTKDLQESFSDTLKVNVEDSESCYEPKITTKSRLTNKYEQDIFSATVENKGSQEVTYQVSLEGANWASVVPRTLELRSGESGNLNIAVNPPAEVAPGKYNLILTLDTNGQQYSKTIEVSVKQSGIGSQIVDTLSFYKYYVYTALFLIIMALVFFFVVRKKNQKETKEEKPKKKEKTLGTENLFKTEKKPKKKKKAAKAKKESVVPKHLLAWVAGGVVLIIVILAIAFLDVLQPVKDFLAIYSSYLIIGVVLLLAAIAVVRFVKPIAKFFK